MRKLYETIGSLPQSSYRGRPGAEEGTREILVPPLPMWWSTVLTSGSRPLKFCASIMAHSTGPKRVADRLLDFDVAALARRTWKTTPSHVGLTLHVSENRVSRLNNLHPGDQKLSFARGRRCRSLKPGMHRRQARWFQKSAAARTAIEKFVSRLHSPHAAYSYL